MRSVRRPVTALAGLAVASAITLSPVAAGLGPTPAVAVPTDVTAPAVTVTLDSLRPLVPQAGDTVTATGQLRNISAQPLPQLSVQIRVGEVITSRSVFDTYAADPDGALPQDLSTVPVLSGTIAIAPQAVLQPGATEPFKATLELGTATDPSLPTNAWQVRPLGIAVTDVANPAISSLPQTVGQLRTFLPWAPRIDATTNTPVTGEAPTPVAWIWPVDDWPHHAADGTWADERLAPELAPTGRLTRLVSVAEAAQDQKPQGRRTRVQDVAVTWAIDPMLVGDAASMSAGYTFTTKNKTTTGPGAADAKTWLSALHGAVSSPDAEVLPLPYADPDVVAAARRGLFEWIGRASTSGQTLIEHDLAPTSTLSQYAWPPNGLADARAIDALSALGDTTVVLSDTALPVNPATTTVTPDAHTEVTTGDSSMSGVLTDSVLSNVVDAGAANPADSALALQRYLAETLMIQQQRPSQPRAVVIAPSRRWNPSASYAAELLADTGKVPWISPVSLSTVASSTPTADVPHGPLTYPGSARRAELPTSYLQQFASTQNLIESFSAILQVGDAVTRGFVTAEQEALSSGWRSRPAVADRRLAALRNAVTAQIRHVGITSKPNSYVTLTSHDGKVPVTIANNLSTTVHVAVKVSSSRLTLSNHGRVDVPPIPPHQQTVVEVHAAAKASGVFPVTVQLLSPNGTTYRASVKLYVRSTAYGAITLIITGAATAALMIAVGIRLGRRGLAARRRSVTASE